MTDLKLDTLVKAVENLLTEKQAIAAKEQELITPLNGVLEKMGYQVVALEVPRRGRRGRPPGEADGRFSSPAKASGIPRACSGKKRQSESRNSQG